MKNLIFLFFLHLVAFFNAQDITNIKNDYEKLVTIHIDYEREVNKPNQYFFYTYLDRKSNFQKIYLNKKKYDSLTLLKLPDSVIIRQAIYKIKRDEYIFTCSYNTNQKIYYYQKYSGNQLIQELTLYENDFGFIKKDYTNLTLETYYFGDGKYPFLYKYQKFDRIPFDLFTNMVYQKIYLQDGTVKIYDYKKDFPLSDEEFLKKVPNIFAEQSVEFLKDGKKVKNFSKNTAKNVSLHMLGAIIKAGDNYKYNYKYELKKGYSSDDPSKPVYSFTFFTPDTEFWGLTIDPRTEKLINVDYGKGAIY